MGRAATQESVDVLVLRSPKQCLLKAVPHDGQRMRKLFSSSSTFRLQREVKIESSFVEEKGQEMHSFNVFGNAARAEAALLAEIESSRQVGRPPCGSTYAVQQVAILLQSGSTPSMSNLIGSTCGHDNHTSERKGFECASATNTPALIPDQRQITYLNTSTKRKDSRDRNRLGQDFALTFMLNTAFLPCTCLSAKVSLLTK